MVPHNVEVIAKEEFVFPGVDHEDLLLIYSSKPIACESGPLIGPEP